MGDLDQRRLDMRGLDMGGHRYCIGLDMRMLE